MENPSQDQQGKQGQQGKQPSSLSQIFMNMNFIQRCIYADRLLNKMFPNHYRFCQTGDHHRSMHFCRIPVIRRRSDLSKLVGTKMDVLLALRLLMDKRIPPINNRILYTMAKSILSRKIQIQNRAVQGVPTKIVVLPQEDSLCDVPTIECHPSLGLTARISLNNTQILLQGPNDKVAECISVFHQKYDSRIKYGLGWHPNKPFLFVFDYVESKVDIYEVSLEDRSVKCILTIPVSGVVFSILPHQDSFILISRDNDTNMMKIWRISLETMSMECIQTLLSPLYTMNVFSILPNQMIIADVSNDGLSLTISNPSGKLMCLTFIVERYGFNRVSSILFLARDIMAIGTNCGKIKLFRLSPDYSSAECFALLQEPSDIFPNGGIITYPIRHMTVHPSYPLIFAALVKTYSVKIFKLSSDRTVVLAEINVKKDIRSIRFSTDGSLLLGFYDGSVERCD